MPLDLLYIDDFAMKLSYSSISMILLYVILVFSALCQSAIASASYNPSFPNRNEYPPSSRSRDGIIGSEAVPRRCIHLLFRGGSTYVDKKESMSEKDVESGMKIASSSSTINVLVSTSIGSDFLDKKKKFSLHKNATVYDLKQQIASKFPGSPPETLQRLFFGVREIHGHEVLQNITTMPTIPILLDMITGTSVYTKSLSVSQAIDAYVASTVQQAYLGDQLRALIQQDAKSNNAGNETIPETSYYREMYQQLNESIYSKYADDIRLALEEEREPETISTDTIAWRTANRQREKSSLVKALAKEFDLNLRGLKGFLYYSGLLVVSL
jgi:hypothetical protein